MISRRTFLRGAAGVVAAAALPAWSFGARGAAGVGGRVLDLHGRPVLGARVTVFRDDLLAFREIRTDAQGEWSVRDLLAGDYRLGVSAPGLAYSESGLSAFRSDVERTVVLGPAREMGRWDVVGSTAPEGFGGTNSGSLLTDRRVLYCHDTVNPVIYDPSTRKTVRIRGSSSGRDSEQGCHMPTTLLDGRLLLIGGGTVDDDGNFSQGQRAVRTVRSFDPRSLEWQDWPGLLEPRWYPGVARLSSGRLLVFGGGQQPTRLRTATAEVLDPVTRASRRTGTMLRAGGFAPAIQLYTGEVLVTFWPPQLYDPATGRWRKAGQFVQPKRADIENCPHGAPPLGANPLTADHPDHTAIMLPNGKVAAVGIRRTALARPGSMVEFYDPGTDTWSLGPSPDLIRSMAEVLQLPTGEILVAGGRKEDPASGEPANEFCQLKRADLFDPAKGTWRRVADMGAFREYHAVTLLLPDGRVLTTAGTSKPGLDPPPGANRSIEAFSPPYLFRGPRPRIDAVSTTRLGQGRAFTVDVSMTAAVDQVVLIGLNNISHWMDGGPPRLLRLAFTQADGRVRATVPSDPLRALLGFYLLFVLVDGIPSKGRIVSIQD